MDRLHTVRLEATLEADLPHLSTDDEGPGGPVDQAQALVIGFAFQTSRKSATSAQPAIPALRS